MIRHAPGYHGINAITECRKLDAELVHRLASLLIEEDLETASAEFDTIAREHQLLKWQRLELIGQARSRKIVVLRGLTPR